MASRKEKSELFADLLGSRPVQSLLFPEQVPQEPQRIFYPPIHRSLDGFNQTLAEAQAEGALGYDLEFQGERPSIVGIASLKSAASLPYELNLVEQVWDSGLPLVGHAVVDADKPVTEAVLGHPTDLSRWEDTLLYFYLLHQHYAKTEDRSDSGTTQGESGSIGLFDLFSCTAHYVLIPRWKDCRGKYCTGISGGPCPYHAPFEYNAVDAWAPLVAWYEMKREYAKRFQSDLPYRHKAETAAITCRMKKTGVQLDMSRAAVISADIAEKREQTGKELPFNPASPKQVVEYFNGHNISLESAARDNVLATLREVAEDYGYALDDIDETAPELLRHLKNLHDWKLAGKGIQSWTDPKYLDRHNKVHPRFIVASTSTGRLSSSSPNFQNVPKRGGMSAVRQVIVPSHPDNILLGADYSQMELRIVLFEAGYTEALEGDTYNLVTESAGELFAGPARDTNRKPRDIAKIVVLGTNYLLGYHAYNPRDLRYGMNKRLLNEGALYEFPDWEYAGMQMCMNGKKLAYLLFGNDEFESRKRAIEIQLGYLNRFPKVLEWQKRVAEEIELTGQIRRKSGYFLELLKDPNDNLKKAAAFIGQGYGGDYCQGAMRNFYRKYGAVPILQIHDECIFEVPKVWSDQECVNFMNTMTEETDIYPGFRCPIEIKRGPSWGEMKEIVLP